MQDVNHCLQETMDPSSSSIQLERRSSGEEDPAGMTIEFLRARLLSERSVSNSSRERAQQLAKKVAELEKRLEAEIQLRKKLEADRLEILFKYRAELSEEYGGFLASSLGEGNPGDVSTLGSLNSRKHDVNGESVSYARDEDGQGLPNDRLEQLDRIDSSQQFRLEKASNEDDEIDHSGQEKGVLLWGRRKGSRKEFGHGIDWYGRSFSQRSFTSIDCESPQKKWAGKSVRQIRKRDSRSYDTYEGENGQTQAFDELDYKIGQLAALRERLPCENERDTEVERVLEQQAEFIEQYEAEENAQRAREAKFKEGKAISNDENEHMPKGTEEILVQSDSIQNSTSQDIGEHIVPLESHPACSIVEQVRVGISPGEPAGTEKGIEDVEASELSNEDCLHGQLSSNMDAEQSIEPLIEATMELGKRSKYRKHLSSSFRFVVFPDSEPVAGSSPHMDSFIKHKQDEHKSKEFGELNGSRRASESSNTHHHDSDDRATPTASLDNNTDENGSHFMGNHTDTEDLESQEKGKAMLKEDVLERKKSRSHSFSENDVMDSLTSVDPSNNSTSRSFKEEENRRLKGLEGEQGLQSVLDRHFSESSSYIGSRRPSGSTYLQQRQSTNLLPHPDYGFLPFKVLDGAALFSGIRSGSHGSGLHTITHEETAFRSHRKSVDDYDRVDDVLKALEIAKVQVQSSNEQDLPLTGDRNDYDGRDAFCAEAPRLASVNAAPPQPYAISAPYSFGGPATYMHNMHGWGTASSGYGVGLSRHVGNTPYMPYPTQLPEARNRWLPSSSGVHNSHVYHYDTRQHR